MDELASKIYESTIGIAAEIENYMRRERTTRGIREAVTQRGQLPGGGAGLYGYDYNPKSKGGDGKRIINKEEARVVRLIFRWFVEGRLTIHRVAKRLEEMGIRTKKGKEKWRYSTLDRLLRNPVYCGKTYAYRWQSVEPKKPQKANRRSKKSSVKLRPREDWVELEGGSTPPIIPVELWEGAQQQLKQNFKKRREPKYPYLLRGMVKCYCGKSMVACSISKKYRYYRCGARSGVDVTHSFLIPAQMLDEAVWETVREALTDPKSLIMRLKLQGKDDEAPLKERIGEAKKAIADLKGARRRAVSLYSWGKLDEREIDDEVEALRRQQEAWESELAKLEDQLRTRREVAGQVAEIEKLSKTVSGRLNHLSFQEKRDLLERLPFCVTIQDDQETFACSIGAREPICKWFPTPSGWELQTKPIPFEFEGVVASRRREPSSSLA